MIRFFVGPRYFACFEGASLMRQETLDEGLDLEAWLEHGGWDVKNAAAAALGPGSFLMLLGPLQPALQRLVVLALPAEVHLIQVAGLDNLSGLLNMLKPLMDLEWASVDLRAAGGEFVKESRFLHFGFDREHDTKEW